MAKQIMTYNSQLENYLRAGVLTEFEAAETIYAGDFVFLDGGGLLHRATDPMLLFGTGGIAGVAEGAGVVGDKVLVWQTGVFEFPTASAQAITPGRYLFVSGNATTVDLGGGHAQEISCGVAESGTPGIAAAEAVEVFITPVRKRSPYLYDSSTPYL